ncbi:hypothetical protein [Cytobacillus gottheilii]|uniref:hypothetical protein n=1 Tax=Cytobacillus gottheilii TaxID=859144 RepID=UPI002494A967|nr:hypothetical protein [Cytobacillus gottheilii]
MQSIHTALYVEKVNAELTTLGIEYDFVIDDFSSMEQWADRSDLAQLNNEYQSGKLKIIKEISNKDIRYTHIVLDTDGCFFAVIIKDGDWVDYL